LLSLAPTAWHGLVALLAVLFDRDGDVPPEASRTIAPQPPTPPLPGYRHGDDVPAGNIPLATVEREVLTRADLLIQIYLIEAAASRRDGPQVIIYLVDLAGVERQHPARRALQDGLPYAFFSGGVPGIG
jgi:hypothetical protein